VTVLLFLVAFSDLSHADGGTGQMVQSKDASGVANKLT